MTKPTISGEAMSLVKEHPLASNMQFLVDLSDALSGLHYTVVNSDRVAIMNRLTASHLAQRSAEQQSLVDANALSDARIAGAQAERKRIASILRAPEAKDREEVACSLAFDTDMPSPSAIVALGAAPADKWAKVAQPISSEPREEVLLLDDGTRLTDLTGLISPTPPRGDRSKALWADAVKALNEKKGDRA